MLILTKHNVNNEWTYALKLYTWDQKYEIAVAIASKWATVMSKGFSLSLSNDRLVYFCLFNFILYNDTIFPMF